ncbi:MAG: FtsX-like permease family protein [Thermoanaerobacteraceae bacterium]|nr:FtsX-like permease family protein [Thermoanaerobacteraceae bacterium]
MIRDIKENKGAYLACMVIITMGLLIFTAFSTMVETLQTSQQSFYKGQNFADGFAQVQAIPRDEIKKLEDISGIKELQGRLVKDVMVYAPGSQENIYLRLVSVEKDTQNPINEPLLKIGSPLEDNVLNIWVDNKFFEANDYDLNDEIEIIASGRKRKLSIAGVASSPEFIYALRTVADMFPSPETFGIAFMPLKSMEKLFPDEKAYNDLVFTLKPGADFENVKTELEIKLKPYGLVSLISRDDQISHLLLSEELKGLVSMSKAMPIMFLSIAAVILYITLKRLIEQQRGQIGILKAEGYTSKEILFHYMSYAVSIGFVGGIMGVASGGVLSYPLTSIYQVFFNLPGLEGRFSPLLIISGIILALSFSLLAGFQGSRKILALEPAEAMRPPAPVQGKRVLLENIRIIWKKLNVQQMMAVRNMSRNKGRSFFIFLGIMFCFAISSFTWSMNDMIQRMMYDQYEKVEVYDVKINLTRPMEQKSVVRELAAFSGVSGAEPMLEVPVTIKNKWREKDVVILGLPEKSSLYNILDNEYNKVTPPKNGLLLSERLAELLDAKPGTRLTVESTMKADDKDGVLQVVGVIPQYSGTNAYMEIGALQDFLKQKGLITSCMLNINRNDIASFREKYMHADAISSIDEKSQRLNKFKDMMASYGSMIYIYAMISVIIGFAIIYSSSVITLSERSRELASMMVLGMTPQEVLSVVTFEQWCIAVPAMLLGIPLARFLMAGLSSVMSTDMYTIPERITFMALLLAFFVTAFSIWIAQIAAARKIKSLSLVEVLKSRE